MATRDVTDNWFQIFKTKNALQHGIVEMRARRHEKLGSVITTTGELLFSGEWYSTRAAAVIDANRRRASKVANLKALLADLEALDFEQWPDLPQRIKA